MFVSRDTTESDDVTLNRSMPFTPLQQGGMITGSVRQ